MKASTSILLIIGMFLFILIGIIIPVYGILAPNASQTAEQTINQTPVSPSMEQLAPENSSDLVAHNLISMPHSTVINQNGGNGESPTSTIFVPQASSPKVPPDLQSTEQPVQYVIPNPTPIIPYTYSSTHTPESNSTQTLTEYQKYQKWAQEQPMGGMVMSPLLYTRYIEENPDISRPWLNES